MVSCYMVPQSSPSHCLCAILYHILDEGVHQPSVNTRGWVSGVGERDHLRCLLNPTLCLMVWGLDPSGTSPGTSQVMAWQTIKHIHVRTHKAHHLCSWGYRQLNYLFHSVFRSTLKNSSTLCIYGLVQVETSGKRWFPHRRLSVRERVCVKTSSYSLVTADALALTKRQVVRV